MCAPSAPPPADFIGAAQAQGASNVDVARVNARSGNPNVINPYGTQTVEWGIDQDAFKAAQDKYQQDLATWNATSTEPQRVQIGTNDEGGPIWANIEGSGQRGPAPLAPVATDFKSDQATVRQQLSPEQQRIFNLNQQGQEGLATVGRDAVNRVGGILGQDVDFSGAPAAPGSADATRDKVINAMMARVDTDLGRRKEATESELIARGIPRGSEAFNREMEAIDRTRTDALNQAQLSAGTEAQRDFGMGMDSRRQAITEILAKRQTPLNEISAIRSGSQVASPQFQNYQGANVAPPPLFNAAGAQAQEQGNIYNAKVASSNQNMQTAGMIGAAAMMMF